MCVADESGVLGNMVHVWGRREGHSLVGKPERKRTSGRPRFAWEHT